MEECGEREREAFAVHACMHDIMTRDEESMGSCLLRMRKRRKAEVVVESGRAPMAGMCRMRFFNLLQFKNCSR